MVDLKDIKQEIKKNKEFVALPLQQLVQMIEHKGSFKGIAIIKISERYTQ